MTAVPRDDEAEAVVVGCAVALHHGYELAAGRLTADDFWAPTTRRLFEACASLESIQGTSIDDTERRIYEAARITGVPVLQIRQLVDDRPIMWDLSGSYAARLRRPSDAREVMAACAAVYNRLGEGEGVDRVAGQIQFLAERLTKGAA